MQGTKITGFLSYPAHLKIEIKAVSKYRVLTNCEHGQSSKR
jgi:hypothetical protein